MNGHRWKDGQPRCELCFEPTAELLELPRSAEELALEERWVAEGNEPLLRTLVCQRCLARREARDAEIEARLRRGDLTASDLMEETLALLDRMRFPPPPDEDEAPNQ